ncbi:MAG: DNRLRE domain-containing protein [Actinomycetes bacterium]
MQLPAVADTWVGSDTPTTPRGTAVKLEVDGSPARQSLLAFDLSALAGRTVTGATLRLYQVDQSRSGGNVRLVTGAWDEASTTWDTRPTTAPSALAAFGAVAKGYWYEVALPADAVGGSTLSLGIDSAVSDGVVWTSRESSTPPALVVTLAADTSTPEPAPEPEPTPEPAPAEETVVVRPVEDTFVDSSAASAVRGGATYLAVDASPARQALVRFDLSAWSGREVLSATLRLHQVDQSKSGGRVRSVASGWSEATTTWDTRPSLGDVVASFGAVVKGSWYEVGLPVSAVGTGVVDLAMDSTSGDGADWASRESANDPELVVVLGAGTTEPPPPDPVQEGDGLTQVADGTTGSSDSTNYPLNRRSVRTAGGRLLAVHGLHGSGLQLAWRDVGGTWRQESTGDSATGTLLAGTGTGDWPASIAVTTGPDGAELAWVVWAGKSKTQGSAVHLRRLTDLDAAGGPRVGPLVTVDPAPGAYRADVAFERLADGSVRGCVVYSRPGSSVYELAVVCSADLGTDAPSFGSRVVLDTTSSTTRSGSLVPTPLGMRVVARAGGSGGSLVPFGHDAAAAPDAWWRAAATGPVLPTGAWPTGVALSTGEVVAAVEHDVTTHTSSVHRFSADGSSVATLLSAPGLAQPTLAGNGAGVWLVGVRTADGAAVSRAWSAAVGWGAETVEADPTVTGPTLWPNPVRDVDGRLRLLLGSPGATSSRTTVWWSQRPV